LLDSALPPVLSAKHPIDFFTDFVSSCNIYVALIVREAQSVFRRRPASLVPTLCSAGCIQDIDNTQQRREMTLISKSG